MNLYTIILILAGLCLSLAVGFLFGALISDQFFKIGMQEAVKKGSFAIWDEKEKRYKTAPEYQGRLDQGQGDKKP